MEQEIKKSLSFYVHVLLVNNQLSLNTCALKIDMKFHLDTLVFFRTPVVRFDHVIFIKFKHSSISSSAYCQAPHMGAHCNKLRFVSVSSGINN